MIGIVDRYVGRAAVLGTLALWVGLTVLYMMLALFGELRATGGDYGVSDAFWFTALTSPRMAYQIFPVASLLGVMVAVGGLAAANELVAFRTSGVSRMRLARAALGGALLLGVPVIIMGEWLAPRAEQQARAFRLSEQVGQAIIGGPRGMWMRDGNDIVNIQLPLLSADRGGQSVEFKNIVIYGFSGEAELHSITRAENASHDGSTWQLEGISAVHFEGDAARREVADSRTWPSEVRPELLDSAVTRPKRLSMRALWEFIAYLGENGLDDRVYRAAFWEKVFYPLSIIALVLAGMPFVFASSRSQNLGMRMFIGMTLGGLFMIVSRAAVQFGEAYDVPAVLTNLLPALLLAVAAVFALRRTA